MWRAASVAVALLGIWAALAMRLAHLHLAPNESLKARVRNMRNVRQEILVGRGRILDRNGNLLALDLTLQNVVVTPMEIVASNQTRVVSAHLARVLGLPFEEVYDRVNRPHRKYEAIKRRVPESVAEKVARMQLTGVRFEPESTRHYPQGNLACQVVGFSNHEGVGSAGIEQRWDYRLKGVPGFRISEKDGNRREIYSRRTLEVDPQEGANVYLTIDQNVQYYTEKGLEWGLAEFNAHAGWSIVQEVRTGEILAMASRPAFDLNEFNKTGLEIRRNLAIAYNFEPGSIFKVSTVAAAINEGIVGTNDLFDCEMGRWRMGRRVLRDYSPHGLLDVTGILRKSSNIGTAKIAMMLGDETFHRYLTQFGIGRSTGIELPGEEAGILHPLSRWGKMSSASVSMGHEVSVTALQILGVLACIGNDGYMMRPRIVQKVVDKDGVVLEESKPEVVARPITERTAELMRKMLLEVTKDDGTGRRAAIPGYAVAGKTGTAEKVVDGRYVRNQNVASFIGLLPAERPQIAIIVVLDDPQPALRTGGTTAAPVFAKIAEPVARYLDILPSDPVEVAGGGAP
jgi:cell division protein FtsI (penicillin-binding protein 3)